jgi:hypothetical protein
MWTDWLAETLNRSTIEAPLRDSKVRRVLLSDPEVERARESTEPGALLIHEGFGAEYPDA